MQKMLRGPMLAVAGFGALATACQTDLTGLNKNPNNPTSAPPEALFANAAATVVGRFEGANFQLSHVGLLAQHIAQVQYVDEDRYVFRSANLTGYQDNPYTNELMDFQKVMERGEDMKSPLVRAPATIMQAWTFQTLTDVYGDLPFSETLKGSTGPLKPKYDAQKDIYTGLLKSLTDASTSLGGASGAALGAGDPIYAGNGIAWRRFANSLRARMALRMQKADPATSEVELKAAFSAAGGLFVSNVDNAIMTWPGDGVFDNPWSVNFAARDDHRVSRTLLDTMNALGDPRVSAYAQPTANDPSKIVGLQNGMDNATASAYFKSSSRPGLMFYPGSTVYGTYGTAQGRKTPSIIMTYAEVAFIQAEAANRGLGGLNAGQAKGFYDAGVRASVLQWGGSDSQAEAYLARTGVTYAGGAEGLRQIGLQKWIALFTQGQEAWSEWRRTGNPSNIKPGPKATLTAVPRRLTYSSNEQTVNAANLAAAIARQGADALTTRVWWDKP